MDTVSRLCLLNVPIIKSKRYGRVRWSMINGEQVVLNEDTERTERGYQEISKNIHRIPRAQAAASFNNTDISLTLDQWRQTLKGIMPQMQSIQFDILCQRLRQHRQPEHSNTVII